MGADPVFGIVGDEECAPLAPACFDLAVSALALQHANDLPGVLVQIRQALKPDGLFLGCLLGGRSLNELRTALAAAETELCGGVSPRVAPFADVRDIGGLLQRAGFALPVADSEPLTVRYANMFGLMADLRAMGASNALETRLRKPTPRALFFRAAQIYAERFADPDGRVRATFELIFASGWAPHESQQKPLAPGSARMRLADALRPPTLKPEDS
jgi:SAM-dependent methyltransferase